jgi:hypothetical protein
MSHMQVISAVPNPTVRDRLAAARAVVLALLLLVVGALVAWLVLSTPLLGALVPGARPSPGEIAAFFGVWLFAIVLPAGFLVLAGAHAFVATDRIRHLLAGRARPRLARDVPPECRVAVGLRLGDGRGAIHEAVIGPFGVAVLGALPPAAAARRVSGRWEQRDADGRWITAEGPLARTARDADRLRRWIAAEDHDVTVRVYAAVVTDDTSISRTPACAVVPPDALATWLSGIAAQRSFTPERRDALVARIRQLAG